MKTLERNSASHEKKFPSHLLLNLAIALIDGLDVKMNSARPRKQSKAGALEQRRRYLAGGTRNPVPNPESSD